MVKNNKQVNNNLKKDEGYYDSVDLSEEFNFKKAKLNKAKIKRVNIQIPFELYLEAVALGQRAGTGYQNAMKIAMSLGFKDLENHLSKK